MFMKQDIWRVDFQACIRSERNVPELADHHSADVARLVGASPLYVPLQRAARFFFLNFGRGGAAYGDRGKVGEGDELLQ